MNLRSDLVPLVDADIITYRCGFAAKGEPLSHVLQTVKTSMDNIYELFCDAPRQPMVYLTGKDNYREYVAVTRPYKGNRDPNSKPEFYKEIRQYLQDYHGAIMIDGMEADDALGIEQWANKDRDTVIVSIDKDLLCIPGYHYNFVRNEFRYVTLKEANRCFWTQVLTGDSTDNIEGLPKYGEKTAQKVLAGIPDTWEDLYVAVKNEYNKVYDDEAEDKFREMATLVWILREPNTNFDGTPIVKEEECTTSSEQP